jgi:hypothetical protein
MDYVLRPLDREGTPYRRGPADAPKATRAAADIEAALRAIVGVKVSRDALAFRLHGTVEQDTLSVTLADDAVGVDGVAIAGASDRLAFDVAVALVPLFGHLEIAFSDYAARVDGTEPAAALHARLQEDLRARLEAAGPAMGDLFRAMEPFTRRAEAIVAERHARERRGARIAAAVVGACAVLAGIFLWTRRDERHTGGTGASLTVLASARTTSGSLPLPTFPTDEPVESAPSAVFGAVLPSSSVMDPPDDLDLRFLALGGLRTSMSTALDPNRSILRRNDSAVVNGRTLFAVPLDATGRRTAAFGLPFWIRQITTRQTPLAAAPWHKSGGDWTFIDAVLGGGRLLVGLRSKPAPLDVVPEYESGEGRLVANDAASAEKVLAALGSYLHTQAPASRVAPPKPLSMRVGIFGRTLRRGRNDTFERSGDPSSWTAAKLTLEANDDAPEIYLAFDPELRIGELSEKEPELRDSVVAVVAARFRGGVPKK